MRPRRTPDSPRASYPPVRGRQRTIRQLRQPPIPIHLAGDYVLRLSDSYTVMLLLSGNPTAHTRIQQEGLLTLGAGGGVKTVESMDSDYDLLHAMQHDSV